MSKLTSAWAAFLVKRPGWSLIAFAALFLPLAWQASRFEIDASADTLLTKNDRDYLQTQIVSQRFSPDEFLLLAYQPSDRDALSRAAREDIAAIAERIRGIEGVAQARSILNVPFLSLAEGSLTEGLDAEALTLESRELSDESLRRLLAGHPLYENLLINADLSALAIQVTFEPDETLAALDQRRIEQQARLLERPLTSSERAAIQALEEEADPLRERVTQRRNAQIKAIRAIMADYEDRADLYLGGAPVLAFQLIEIIKKDLVVFGGAIAAIVSLLLLVIFRRIRWVLLPIGCCAASIVMSMGLFGALGLKATVISANFVALQLILTLAIVVHLIVQYRESAREDAQASHDELLRRTLAAKTAPCLYAGLTTSVGFATLLLSGLQPVISFGLMMIIAVFISIFTSLVIFPCALALIATKTETGESALAGRFLRGIGMLTRRAGATTLALSAVLLAVCIWGALRLTVENSFINYFRESTQVRRELAFIDKEFGGTTPLDIIYKLPPSEADEDLIITAESVADLQAIQRRIEEMPATGKVLSLVNFAEVARKANGDRPLTEYEITAAYRTLDTALRDKLLGTLFNAENREIRFSVRLVDTTPGLDRGAFLADLRQELRAAGATDEHVTLTNLLILYENILQQLFRSQILTLGVVFIALFIAFLAIFRSWRVAVIAIAPNALSTGVVLGVMGWLGVPLDLMTITIAAVAMGIAVDDTIHYTHRYRERIAAGESPTEANRTTNASVGYAILYTSLIITIGFASLAFSDFVPSSLFGLLTGLSIAAALLFDLTTLPILLMRFVRGAAPKSR